VAGRVDVRQGDACKLKSTIAKPALPSSYSIIFTSPPYGDSRSTVSYGEISSICLGVLRHIPRLNLGFRSGCEIDSLCLGGTKGGTSEEIHLDRYWKGKRDSREAIKILTFLAHTAECCEQISQVSRTGTKAILVVGRRCVRHHRLYLDHFFKDQLASSGFTQILKKRRSIARKNTPYTVDIKGRSRETDTISTMAEEFVLVFEKK
jgi:hypothetical protein